MNDTPVPGERLTHASGQENMSARFASMVVQQTNLALMLLGKMPHPDSGETMRDIEGAKMLIDQLEMIELKTRGNLEPQEERLLKQSLTALRMAFVEAVDRPAGPPQPAPSASAGESAKAAEQPESSTAAGQTGSPASEEESRKKFSKKY